MNPTGKRQPLIMATFLILSLFTALFESGYSANAAEGVNTPARDFVIGRGVNSPFGLNIQSAARYAIPGSLQVPLDSAKGTGAGWNREELRWDIVEPTAGQFDYTLFDEAINKSLDRGINVLGLLDYNVNRNTGGKAGSIRSMPDLNAWQNYVSKVVSRYKDKVKYWEIWNEPSDPNYLAIPDNSQRAAAYAQILSTSYTTIKRIDPNAQVVTGGVSGFDVPFLQEVLNQGGAGKFDILGVHPYVNFSASPDSKYWADTQIAYFLNFANSVGKPVWATEFGWSNVGPYAVDQSRQANYLARSYVAGLAAGLQKMFIYEFHDNSLDANSRYGLVGTDWKTQKPAYGVYRNLISQLTDATFRQRFDPFDTNRTQIEGFDNGNPFGGGFANSPSVLNVSRATDQVHSGSGSLRLDYDFRGNSSNYIEVGRQFPLPGQPSKVGVWVYGDGKGASVRILLKDANGRGLNYEVGQVGAPGWQRREAWLPGERSDGSSGGIAYPVTFLGVQLYSRPDGAKWGGTVYLDDIYAATGPNASAYRFEKNGQTIDVLWTDGGSGGFSIPSNSAQGQLFDRNGSSSTVNADGNGNLNLSVGDDMVFLVHQGKPLTGATPGGNPGGQSCGSTQSSVNANSNFPNDWFRNLWLRYDLYAAGARSYVWGDKPFAIGSEPYYQALDGNAVNTKTRQVVYFDKSRMEITRASNNPFAAGYVTNGLLTVELITGKVQTGDDQGDPLQYQQCSPAKVPVAGDPDDTSGPKYASLQGRLSDGAKPVGATVTETIDASGNLGSNPSLSGFGVVGGYYEPVTKHTIAKPFWDFLNDPTQKIFVNGQPVTGKLFDPYYEAPGLPITEAYWAKVKVAGQVKDVLVQAFERRVLTFTPDNPAAFRVEWGNIGRHYFTWRYNATLS